MKQGAAKYRKMMNELDQKGFLIHIQRINKKTYYFIVNGTILKVYKQRQSCNNRLVKQYKELKTNFYGNIANQ